MNTVIIDPDENLTTDDIHTIDDCDRAENILEKAIVTISMQLSDHERVKDDPNWAFAAKHALAAKKYALRVVQRKRGQLKREFALDWREAFINSVKKRDPSLFQAVLAEVGTAA